LRNVYALLVLLVTGQAQADPIVLRMASAAPEGTAWARELNAFARDVEGVTEGAVRVKWYLGAVAGDELTVIDRIRRGQLDGAASSVMCSKLAPSLKVTRIIGLIRQREELSYVLTRLYPTVAAEFGRAGFASIAVTGFGADMPFTRTPVRTFDELRKLKLWIWNIDEVGTAELPRFGLHVVPMSLEEAGRAYDDGRIDGFISLPTSTLAFQWSTRARYFTPLPISVLTACLVISNRVFDALPIAHQQSVRAAGVKLGARFADVNYAQEDLLLGGLLVRQGLQRVPVSELLRTEFLTAAHAAREHLDPKIVPAALIDRVNGWLADYRAEHR
jgi:TRAP-type C4-dicarboxylate transport system substrate-binding protein